MSQTDESFDTLQQALQSIYPQSIGKVDIRRGQRSLLLSLPTDVAAFTVLNGQLVEEFADAYRDFKRLYRENHVEWDKRTLSFVLCRTTAKADDDRFYAEQEHDPLFCRKYVIRACRDTDEQKKELLRLPFLPLPESESDSLQRPQSARDLLQATGISATLARSIVESGHKAPEKIARELVEGDESFPTTLTKQKAGNVTLSKPRAYSRLTGLAMEGFRAYKGSQHFDLNASVIVLYGPNGLGKTSLFDAIEYACTGRIQRLCRHQKRVQSDFARLATHLDKTAGTGSVVLTGRTEVGHEPAKNWTLKRGTGDWGTAWLDDNAIPNRKEVLSFLTHADWLEAEPRQQTFETLFRATHLFGQDDQELLNDFKRSVIPEEFISEMLALQDYSQGLTKIKGVTNDLASQRLSIEKQRDEVDEKLKASIAALSALQHSSTAATAPTPVEELLASLRQLVRELGLSEPPADASTSLEIEEWLDVIVARQNSLKERASLAESLRDEIPSHLTRLVKRTSLQTDLHKSDKEIGLLSEQVVDLDTTIDAATKSLHQAELDRRLWEQNRTNLRAAIDSHREIEDISTRSQQLQSELQAQIAIRTDIDERLSSLESDVSNLSADEARTTDLRDAKAAEVSTLSALLKDFPQFQADLASLAGLTERELEVHKSLRDADAKRAEAEGRVEEVRLTQKAMRPEYERWLLQQEELHQLLDKIERHVATSACPLCGSEFDSLASLVERIRTQRGRSGAEGDIVQRYNSVVAAVHAAEDALGSTTNDQAMAESVFAKLASSRTDLEDRIAVFKDAALSVLEANTELDGPALSRRLEGSAQQLSELEEKAVLTKRKVTELLAIRQADIVQRDVVNRRIADLERQIRVLNDQVTQLTASVRHVLGLKERLSDDEINEEIGGLTKMIDDSIAESAKRVDQKRNEEIRLNSIQTQLKTSIATRDALREEISVTGHAIAEVTARLGSFGLSDQSQPDEAALLIAGLEREAAKVDKAVDEAHVVIEVLRGREQRLQLGEKQAECERLQAEARRLGSLLKNVESASVGCLATEKLLKTERQEAIEKHMATYGPLITNIQQRLRSVYGFGEIQLQARGGEAVVEVEWRNQSVQVHPTDFFSDSQKQILMLSIFLAGGLRQNWSGFAPVLLDDPVTHFDDLNAFGFVELIRGIISSHPKAWQFVISTCEDRLFSLMQQKFKRVAGGAMFYEYLGMTEEGPIVERR